MHRWIARLSVIVSLMLLPLFASAQPAIPWVLPPMSSVDLPKLVVLDSLEIKIKSGQTTKKLARQAGFGIEDAWGVVPLTKDRLKARTTKLFIVQTDRKISNQSALGIIRDAGLRPATLTELLAFANTRYSRNDGTQEIYVAMGTIIVPDSLPMVYPMFYQYNIPAEDLVIRDISVISPTETGEMYLVVQRRASIFPERLKAGKLRTEPMTGTAK